MKRSYALGFSGLALAVAAAGYNLQASESPKAGAAEVFESAMSATVQAPLEIKVYKSPTCGCCTDWVEHLENNGFAAAVESVDHLQEVKVEYKVPRDMASCHTAVIDGMVVEGHVPAEDIKAYLERRKDAIGDESIGIAVPGMPHGTPGMETGRRDSYAVLAFTATGDSAVIGGYGTP